MNLRKQTLDGAARNISRLNAAIENVKRTDTQRLQNEYQKLLTGLRSQGALPSNENEGGTSGDCARGLQKCPWMNVACCETLNLICDWITKCTTKMKRTTNALHGPD